VGTLVADFEYEGANPDAGVTEKQIDFIESLANERELDADEEAVSAFGAEGVADLTSLTRAQASELIEYLKSLPRPRRQRSA
jgi:hypothetical protein